MVGEIFQVNSRLLIGAPQLVCKGFTGHTIQTFSGEVGFQLAGVAASSIGRALDRSKRQFGTDFVRKYIDCTPCALQPCF